MRLENTMPFVWREFFEFGSSKTEEEAREICRDEIAWLEENVGPEGVDWACSWAPWDLGFFLRCEEKAMLFILSFNTLNKAEKYTDEQLEEFERQDEADRVYYTQSRQLPASV